MRVKQFVYWTRLITVASMLALFGCGGEQSISKKQTASLPTYKTFGVRSPISANGVLPTTHMHVFADVVVQAVERQMVSKGYILDQDNPQVILAPIWWVETNARSSAFNSTAANNGGATSSMNTSATLEIDALDGKTLKAIWRGIENYTLAGSDFNQAQVRKAVN
ncbi:MAG TPA: DUF4136 domain-containing protein, partial [Opitutales bacterium]|nr:DUF4136 domain-containing protein [Opitutales bacterium]